MADEVAAGLLDGCRFGVGEGVEVDVGAGITIIMRGKGRAFINDRIRNFSTPIPNKNAMTTSTAIRSQFDRGFLGSTAGEGEGGGAIDCGEGGI